MKKNSEPLARCTSNLKSSMHPHVGEDPPTRYLAAGVTAIRDLGSPLGAFAAVDRDDASLIRPRIWFSGPILNAGRVVRGPLLDINPRRILEAEGVGFEPTSPFGRQFSRLVHLTTLPPLQALPASGKLRPERAPCKEEDDQLAGLLLHRSVALATAWASSWGSNGLLNAMNAPLSLASSRESWSLPDTTIILTSGYNACSASMNSSPSTPGMLRSVTTI